jgi:hypothetical protein
VLRWACPSPLPLLLSLLAVSLLLVARDEVPVPLLPPPPLPPPPPPLLALPPPLLELLVALDE